MRSWWPYLVLCALVLVMALEAAVHEKLPRWRKAWRFCRVLAGSSRCNAAILWCWWFVRGRPPVPIDERLRLRLKR